MLVSDPSPAESAQLEALVEALASARDRAEAITGDAPLGVRAVEVVPGRRGYLVAFPGPRFLCLDETLAPERSGRRARETASAGLLAEHAESEVAGDPLRGLAQAVGRALSVGIDDPPEVTDALADVAQRALDLASWSDAPERAIASVPRLDEAVALQALLLRAWRRYVVATQPLADAQDGLDEQVLSALRAVEEAGAEAGAGRALTDVLARAVSGCDVAADEIVAGHVTRLRDDDL